MNERTRNFCLHLVAVLFLVALAAVSLRTTRPPTPQPPRSSADFSTDQALEHVRVIASEPHPNGSEANGRVRAYLLDQLARLGTDPRVQTGGIRDGYDHLRTVNNIVARLHGAAAEKGGLASSVILAAHYDSVSRGPGASDDGAAVGMLLETVRALRAGGPPRQDIVVLITDGEELGLLGAQSFVETERAGLKADTALVINFDARGTGGPSIMYENGPGNLKLIRHFAAADPYPIANSLAYDVSRLLPNSTDFRIFKRAGLTGLNFAFIDNYFYYHTKNDTVEHLDRGSLYHDGAHALSLARHFAGLSAKELAEINAPDQGEAVYFNLTPSMLVVYSAGWIWPLTILAWLAGGAGLALGFRRRRITGRGIAGAFAAFVLSLAGVVAGVYGIMAIVNPPQTPGGFNAQLVGIIATSMVLTFAVRLLMRRFTQASEVTASGVILLGAMMIPVNIYVPGGSFLFVWPALLIGLGLIGGMLLRARAWGQTGMMMVASAPVVVLWTPLLVMLFSALTLRLAPTCSVGVVLATWMILSAFGSLRLKDVSN